MQKLLIPLLLLFSLSSCWDFRTRPRTPERKVPGYKATYTTDSALYRIQTMSPRPVQFAGKIYVKDKLIFQSDVGYGIHVIDNTNPATATRVGFIRIPGNSEMSIKGNYMYANSFNDLVVIDISNWQNAREVKRMPQTFFTGDNSFYIPLPEHRVYFECPAYFTGRIQTGWVKDSVSNYSCYNP